MRGMGEFFYAIQGATLVVSLRGETLKVFCMLKHALAVANTASQTTDQMQFGITCYTKIVLALSPCYAFGNEMRCSIMAHVKKFTKANMQGLSIHLDRKTLNHSNKDIDVERSHLNYDLCEKDGDTLSRLQERLDEVYCLKRKDVKACCEWVVTLPENLSGIPENEQREFFEKTYEFLANRYGGEKNVVSAKVHMDETTPHMHFDFVPVVWDEKKQREKVSAKEVLTRKELQSFHQDLDDFLKNEIPGIYRGGILNDKTIGIEDVKDLKKYSEQIVEEKKKLEQGVQSLKKEIEDRKKESLALSEKIPDDGKVQIRIKGNEVKTEVKQKMIGNAEVIKKKTENLIVTPEELKNMQDVMNAAYQVKKDYERLQKTDLVQENKKLREENKELHEVVDRYYEDWKEISAENMQLKEKNRALTALISDLKAEMKLVYQSAKEFVKERTNNAMAFKDAFKSLVSKIKQKVPGGEFEKAHQKDLNKEKNRGMER